MLYTSLILLKGYQRESIHTTVRYLFQDGFKQFDVQASKQPGIRCTIQFAVDTDNLEEDEYLLEIGSLGYVVSGRCLTESGIWRTRRDDRLQRDFFLL